MDTSHDLDSNVQAAIAAYEPRLFDGTDYSDLVVEMRHLVTCSRPVSPTDAVAVFAALSRMIADTVTAGETPVLDELITEYGVNRWSYRALATGAKLSLVEVHRGKLARLLRVKRGLPARIENRGDRKSKVELIKWETIAECLEGELLATFVAAVGAGLTASKAVGATVEMVDECCQVRDAAGNAHPIADEICGFASTVQGIEIQNGSWSKLKNEVTLTDRSCVATFTWLCLQQPLPFRDVRSRYRLGRRYIDNAITASPPLVLDDDYGSALRQGSRP